MHLSSGLHQHQAGVGDEEDFAIVEAASQGSFQDVEALVFEGRSVKSKRPTDGRTALHEATKKGDTRTARLLLVNHAEIDARDHEQYTPLHYAASYGHLDCVKLLVESGANLSLKADGETALQKAKICNHDSTVNYLLSATQTKGLATPVSGVALNSVTNSNTKPSSANHSAIVSSQQRSTTTTAPSPASSFVSDSSNVVLTRREQTALVLCSEDILGLVDFEKDASLAQIRKQLRDDEVVPRGLSYRFFFKDTGAPITEKQEIRFRATECMVPNYGKGNMPAFLISKPTQQLND